MKFDQAIETYISSCRQRIPSFVETHFSLAQTWQVQQSTFWWDLLITPVNTFWAIPYVTTKRALEIIEKVGIAHTAKYTSRIPSGIRSGYQRKIEKLICREVLAWDGRGLPAPLMKELEKTQIGAREMGNCARALKDKVNDFFTGRALVSDLSGSLLTVAFSWYVFGNRGLSVKSMAYRFAKKRAHDEAANNFFLGKGVGNAFYEIFPPTVSQSRVDHYALLLGIAFTLGAMVCAILSDPIRRAFGLHQRRLNALLDDMERELFVFSSKSVRRARHLESLRVAPH